MRFLVDECCGPPIAAWLRERDHDVRCVVDVAPGMLDMDVLAWAHREQRILVTADKDFGARVFDRGEPHSGVILLRVDDERPAILIAVLAAVLDRLGEKMAGRFVVASERRIRAGD